MPSTANNENPLSYRSFITFLACFAAALGLTFLLKEPEFTDSQVYVIFLLFFSVGLWLTEAIPAFAVSLFIISFLVFALGNPYFNSAPEPIDKYVNTFSSSVIWLLLGGFFLAAAMKKTGLDEALFRFTLRISGNKPSNLLIGIMATTVVASMVMSNTATTAMVLASLTPLLNTLGKTSKTAKGLILGVPIAASTGGMATIIGTPPNAIAVGLLENAGIKIDFLTWMMYGTPLAIVLTAISCFVLIKLFMKDKTPLVLDFMKGQEKEMTREFIVKRRRVIIIILATVALWLTTSLHGLKVASICAVPLVFLTVTRILDGKDIRALGWDTLLLVAGGLSLGAALVSTGLLSHYADMMQNIELSTLAYLVLFAFATMIFSNVMSHTATSTVMIPLGMAILVGFRMEVALIIALASSSALFLPVSTPPNAVAFSTGLLEQKDFRTGGILLGILGPLLSILWILFLT